MKKLSILFCLLFVINANATYFDLGIGIGGASSVENDKSLDDMCDGCDDLAIDLMLHVGGKINDQFYLAGGLEALGHRYEFNNEYDDYMQLNSYLLGPIFIVYPVEHLQISASIGISWTYNTNSTNIKLDDGTGGALSLSIAWDSGIENGVLLGGRLFYSNVALDETNNNLSNTGICLFIAFAHK